MAHEGGVRYAGALSLCAAFAFAATLGVSAPAHALTELTGIAKITAGAQHTCAVTTGGAAKCWGSNYFYGTLGNNSYSDSSLPVDALGLGSGVAAIASSAAHTCALTTGGGVYCWGQNSGRLGNNSTYDSPVPRGVSGLASGALAISAGRFQTCALMAGGGVKCWGTDAATPTDVAGLSAVAAIAVGTYHACALTTGGAVKCWGNNAGGQLGDGGASGSSSATPVNVTGLASGVTAIAAGSSHTCALATGGAVKCWGENFSAQLGDNRVSGPQSATPVSVSGLAGGATGIAAGLAHTCAVVAGGGVKCWGNNGSGRLGDNGASGGESAVPVDVSGLASGVAEIAAGQDHSCARTTGGGVKCWGANYSGQLGDNTTTSRPVPADVLSNAPLGPGVSGRIAVGIAHTCWINSGGGAQCWGHNAAGQLGDNSTTNRLQPVNVSGLASGVAAISAGNSHTCAVTSDGGAKCWGDNDGQLGDNSTTDRAQPVAVTGLASGIAAIAPGYQHTCALTTAGGVKCWGRNLYGQLGNSSTVDSLVPVDVAGLSAGFKAVAAGDGHSCALTVGGGVKCWGVNDSGQAGGNAASQSNVPVDVPGLASGASALSAGWSHSCVVTSGGNVKCWGRNLDGQLGDLSTTNRSAPVDVPGLEGVSAVAAGAIHTCALTTAGAVKCWGSNANGRLGNNSTVASLTPVDVVGLSSGVIAIAADYSHTCALTSTGGVKCWGDNQSGQLGSGGTTESHVPVDVQIPRVTPTVSAGLLSGINPSALGQALTFFGVASASVPGLTGTMTFKDGGAIIPGCGPTLVVDTSGNTPSNAQVVCTTTALGAGAHSITVEYSGNGEILGGVSPTHVQSVIAIDPFPFETQDDVGLGVLATSNPVTISGFPGTQPISVSNGGRYSIGCVPPYLTSPGTVSAGTIVCVHHVTPLLPGYGMQTTLTVGGVSSTFQSYNTYNSPLTPTPNIVAGISHNLVIAYDPVDGGDVAWAWGDNTASKLGINSIVTTTIPTATRWFEQVAAGMSHSLGLAGGQVFAWGLNRDGQLGLDHLTFGSDLCKIPGETGIYVDGKFLCLMQPYWIQGLDNVVAISAGWGHSLALKSDGTVWAWGSTVFGQSGASSGERKVPTLVPIDGMVTRIAAGYMHSVALRSDGTVVAWGQGNHGELGPATLASINPTPTVVTGLTGVTDIAAGGGYTLARKSDLSLVAWGSNLYATLGNGSAGGFVQTPSLVMTDVAEFTAGFGFALARKTGGGVYGWGLNNRGQLNGTEQTGPNTCGSFSSRCFRTPTQISSLGGATRIVAGGAHTLTVRPNGDLVIIGDNSVGQHADKSGNYGVPFSFGEQPFVQEVYDPDMFTNPQGTFGSVSSLGRPSTTSPLNLGTMREAFAFGSQGVGTTSDVLALTLTNLSSTNSLTITSVTAAGNAAGNEFVVANEPSPPGCVGVLAPDGTCTMNIRFTPADLGQRYGTLTIQSNAANSNTLVVDLLGSGVDPRPQSVTTLASTANPSNAGSSVTFTASISAPVTPTGTVVFRSDGAEIAGCTAVPVAVVNSSAACPTSALAAGTHGITAEYSGSPGISGVQPSTSSTLTQTVLAPNPLMVTRQGAGSGTVTSSPAGINCGSTCSASFNAGTMVSLSQSAAGGSDFGGWSGACTGTGACSVTMDAARTVNATFHVVNTITSANATTFTVASAGTFTVTATGNPTPTLSATGLPAWANFTPATRILAGTPPPGSVGTHAITFTAANGAAPNATQAFTLTVAKATQAITFGALPGRAMGDPPFGITATGGASGNPVTLTSTTTGVCTVSGTTVTLVATGNCTIAANQAGDANYLAAAQVTQSFAVSPPGSFGLSVSRTGAGSGTVTSTPAGINCGATCAASFVQGTSVNLAQSAASGSIFGGWSGACTGTGACTVTMNSANAVTATFALVPGSLAVNATSIDFGGVSMGTTSPGRTVTVTNTGAASVTFTAVSTSNAQYAVSHSCTVLAPAGTCSATIAFSPEVAAGGLNSSVVVPATLTIASDASGSPHAVALTGVAEKSLVAHYYASILGRAADASGRTFWAGEAERVAALKVDPVEVWFAIAQAFYFSAEYAARNRDNSAFAADLYNTFFNRTPDTPGLNFWVGKLAGGMPREVALAEFMFSTEFRNFTQAIFGNTPVRAEVSMVTDFYRGVLARLPDDSGFAHWAGKFRAAQCQGQAAVIAEVEAISSAFALSPEYDGRRRNNAQYVGDLYNAFLRRGGDLDGVLFWISTLTRTTPPPINREQLRQEFKVSAEFDARVKAVIAQGCLN